MKNRFIKLLLAAVLLGSLSPAAAQTREMDLSGAVSYTHLRAHET